MLSYKELEQALAAAHAASNAKPWPGCTSTTAAYAPALLFAEDKISAIKQQEETLRKASTGAMQLGPGSTCSSCRAAVLQHLMLLPSLQGSACKFVAA
jgi:hypothetical protein